MTTETAPACSINREDGVAIDVGRTRQRVIVGFDHTDKRHIQDQRRAALQATLAASLAPDVRALPSVEAAGRLARMKAGIEMQLATLRERLAPLETERARLLVAGEDVAALETEQSATTASVATLQQRLTHVEQLLAEKAREALRDVAPVFLRAGQEHHRELTAAREQALAELEAVAATAAAAVMEAEVDLSVARQAVLSVQGQSADPGLTDDAAERLRALLGRLGVR